MRRRSVLFAAALLLAAAPARANEGASRDDAPYLAMETMTATILHADGRRGVLTVDCGIDAPDSGVRARVRQSVPRLRAAYAASLQLYAASLRPQTAPDLDRLGAQLQADTDRVIGRPGARFLFGTVLVH
jgi:hypothetical protein